MTNAITVWKWSLSVVARSYRTTILLAVLMALWGLGAYGLLGVPAESSIFLMGLALIWAIAQLLAAALVISGTVAGAGAAVAEGQNKFPLHAVWRLGRKRIIATLVFGLVGLVMIWVCSSAFDWVNGHSLEVASFLTFHLQKPVDQELLESRIFDVIEWLLWVMVSGFLLSYLTVMLREGWGAARKRTGKLLAGSLYRLPFLTGAVSVLVFGGLARLLANWRPLVPPGFWDYTQVGRRDSLPSFLSLPPA